MENDEPGTLDNPHRYGIMVRNILLFWGIVTFTTQDSKP